MEDLDISEAIGPGAFCYDYAVHEHLDQGGRDFVANVLAGALGNGVQGNL